MDRARYEADLAPRSYLHVDPRTVALPGSIEAGWNERLRALTLAQEQYEQQSASQPMNGNKLLRLPVADVRLLHGTRITVYSARLGAA